MPKSERPAAGSLETEYLARLRRLYTAALQEGTIEEGRLAELQRLGTLLELDAAEKARSRQRSWPILAMVFITVIVLTILLNDTRETEIELEVSASEVQFTPTDSGPLVGNLPLTEFHALDLANGTATFLEDSVGAVEMSRADLSVKHPQIGKPATGSITMQSLSTEGGDKIHVSTGQDMHEYEVKVEEPGRSSGLDLSLSVQGRLQLDYAPRGRGSRQPVDLKSAQLLRLHTGPNRLTANLITAAGDSFRLLASRPVRELLFQASANSYTASKTSSRRLSSILSGSVYLEEVREQIPLRPFDDLQFAVVSGAIRYVMVSPEAGEHAQPSVGAVDGTDRRALPLRVRFHGTVRDLRIGDYPQGGRSLMPTWLEWLVKNRKIVLVWSALLYVIGIAMTLLKRWRVET